MFTGKTILLSIRKNFWIRGYIQIKNIQKTPSGDLNF